MLKKHLKVGAYVKFTSKASWAKDKIGQIAHIESLHSVLDEAPYGFDVVWDNPSFCLYKQVYYYDAIDARRFTLATTKEKEWVLDQRRREEFADKLL